jgi:hypothetical protein
MRKRVDATPRGHASKSEAFPYLLLHAPGAQMAVLVLVARLLGAVLADSFLLFVFLHLRSKTARTE